MWACGIPSEISVVTDGGSLENSSFSGLKFKQVLSGKSRRESSQGKATMKSSLDGVAVSHPYDFFGVCEVLEFKSVVE